MTSRQTFTVDYRDETAPRRPMTAVRRAHLWERVRRARADFIAGRNVDPGVLLAIAGDADGRDWLRSMSVARHRSQLERPALADWKLIAAGLPRYPIGRHLAGVGTASAVHRPAGPRIPQPWERGGRPAVR
jgi:hypothetical protein